jgi:multiple sugar transport system substrate-binding protein
MVNRRDFGKIGLAAGLAATLGRPAWAASAADTAVKAAQQYKGRSITIVWEAGLQSLDPTHFSGPKWKELTGMDVKVVEVATAEMFTKIMQDYKSGAAAYDALNVIPAWMPDLAQAGALEVLDPYVEKYGYAPELQTIAPTFRDNWMRVGGKITRSCFIADRTGGAERSVPSRAQCAGGKCCAPHPTGQDENPRCGAS